MGLLLSMGCEPGEGGNQGILFAWSSLEGEGWVRDLVDMQKLPFRDSSKDQTKINL